MSPRMIAMTKGTQIGLVVFAMAAAGSLAYTWKVHRAAEAASMRYTEYHITLARYAKTLQRGQRRQEVETYLKSENTQFGQICRIDKPQRVWADLVKIGQEPAPWYCNRYNVYISLEFVFDEPQNTSLGTHSSDRLESVRLWPHLEECL